MQKRCAAAMITLMGVVDTPTVLEIEIYMYFETTREKMTPFMCAGCQEPILERFLMKVLDKSWHVQCVKCSECQCLLSEKCFSRENKLYCRSDFFRCKFT